MVKTGVYAIECLATGKSYVGSSRNIPGRWSAHRHLLRTGKHHSRRLQRSWDKHGAEKFTFRVVLLCADDMLATYEQIVIDAKDAYNTGLNGAPLAYSALGRQHTEETKQKISLMFKGRKQSDAHRAAKSAAMMGRRLPVEVIEKMRATKTGKVIGPPSAEHRAKISQALSGRICSAEYIEKMKARRHTEDTKVRISEAKAGKKIAAPRDPEHTRRQQEASARTRAAKRAMAGV